MGHCGLMCIKKEYLFNIKKVTTRINIQIDRYEFANICTDTYVCMWTLTQI